MITRSAKGQTWERKKWSGGFGKRAHPMWEAKAGLQKRAQREEAKKLLAARTTAMGEREILRTDPCWEK